MLLNLLKLRWSPYFGLMLSIVSSSASWGQQPKQSTVLNNNGGIAFRILDSATGYVVPFATIKWDAVGNSVPATLFHAGIPSSHGRFMQELSPGEYAFEISAPGYRALRTHFAIAASSVVHSNINLDPINAPRELRDDVVASELLDGYDLIHGYIVDGETHLPLAGVDLSFRQSGANAVSDSTGYFQIYVAAISTKNASRPEDFPAADTLRATASGYKVYTLAGLLYVPGSHTVLRIAMIPGAGVINKSIEHRPLLSPSAVPHTAIPPENPISKSLNTWLSTSGQAVKAGGQQTAQPASLSPATVAVPSSIRVGSNCSNGRYGCATTNTYSLETYVQDGLDKEWISSWNANSLEAGAVAYRSYGAWFVENPICPTISSSCPAVYDICNSTYCQVFNAQSQKATVAAAKATAGVVLSSDGVNIFFAEYAANTNGLYCPDGQTGQPAQNWPCMLDPVAAGSTGSGHGRGMSQWGSQYWARGLSYQGIATAPRDWRCILDHYYNASSNSITVDPAGTGSPGAGSGLRMAFMQGQPTYGSIAYEAISNTGSPTAIRVANAADGSGDHLLVSNGHYPAWEPGGNRLAYANPLNSTGNMGISIINADGSGQTQITTTTGMDQYGNPIQDFGPTWSPLGNKIAFCSTRSGSDVDIWLVNPDGTGLQQVTSGSFIYWMSGPGYEEEGCYLRWSPDGTKIVFTGDTAYVPYPDIGTTWNVYDINVDGSNITQLTSCQSNDLPNSYQSLCGMPSWSPDSARITFSDADTPQGDNIGGGGIYTMNVDGSNIIPVFQDNGTHSFFPSTLPMVSGFFSPTCPIPSVGGSGR